MPTLVSLLLLCSSVRLEGADRLMEGSKFSFGSCFAQLAGTQLTIGNAHQVRSWRLDKGRLYATSLRDLDSNTEWIARPSSLPSPTPINDQPASSFVLRGASGSFSPIEASSLRVELEARSQQNLVEYEFQIFPEAAGVRMWTEVRSTAADATLPAAAADAEPETDALEHLLIDNTHLRLISVTLRDRTDQHNELAFEQEWLVHPNEALLELPGNLFTLEDTLTGNGMIFLKEAPEPEMRPVRIPFDMWFSGSTMIVPEKADSIPATFYKLSFYGNGITGTGSGYPHTLLTYRGGRLGRIAALQQFQRQLRIFVPGRDGVLLSNTWGDRSYEGKLNEAFIRREIDAGKKLGVDVVQIDGGWQLGNTAGLSKPGGAWEGYWAADPHFWDPNPARFPSGFSALATYAHTHGMKLGLWFAPDSSNDFSNWKRDADSLLQWHQQGVDSFKLDSVKIRSSRGEQNYHALIDHVLSGSDGKILLDLDVTAETRQGYFGNIGGGPLFVENRYTDMHRYWPHQTLRNLWKLSQYVDPVRLRMEFLNAERNTRLYSGDPLAPANYSSDTLFATVMFSSPLGWFETSGLSPDFIAHATPLIARWKAERESIDRGTMLPIGSAPDGVAWTGFASIQTDARSGYLLIFRELNPSSRWNLQIAPFADVAYRISVLGGQGNVAQTREGLQVTIPQPLGFVWVKLEADVSAEH